MYKAVIFDLDGTLLDTLQDLSNSVNYALRINNMPEHTLNEIRSFVGDGVKKLVERAVAADVSTEVKEQVLSDFKKHYSKHSMDNTVPYEGIESLLERLREKQIKIAVVSNKIDSATKELCNKFFGIETAIGDAQSRAKKPAPDSVYEALQQLQVSVDDAIYIGDSEVDILTAKNAGMKCISVTWGFRGKEYLKMCGGEAFADNAQELYDLIVN